MKNEAPNAERKITIYHNPRCSKSRETLELLRKAGIEPKVVEYLKTPLQTVQLDALLKQLKLSPEQIVRKGEERFLDLGLDKDPPKTRNAWLKILVDNPILIERPIVTDGLSAVLGRPPRNVTKLISAR